MNTFFRRLSVFLCLVLMFFASITLAADFRKSKKTSPPATTNQATINVGTTNPESNTNEQGQKSQGENLNNDNTTDSTSKDKSANEDAANRWDTSEKTATQLKREAVQQDFDGIIPSPGIVQLDRDGNPVGDIGSKIKDGTVELGDIFIIIIKMMDLLLKAAGTIAVLAIMYGGFQYMLSGFTDEKENAKNTIKWAVVGLIISFLAWLIITVVKTQMTKSPDEYEREAAASSASTTQEFTK